VESRHASVRQREVIRIRSADRDAIVVKRNERSRGRGPDLEVRRHVLTSGFGGASEA
jgi:hypothetical protein